MAKTTVPKGKELDLFLEEYTSKLEERFVAQTHQLKAITDNVASGLFMVDGEGSPTFMNPAARTLTGYHLDEIRGKLLYRLIHKSHDSKESCSVVTALREMKKMKDEEDVFRRKDGQTFPVSFSLAPLWHNNQAIGAVLEFQDITKRKELERQKEDFIGIASHELKTPVTSIRVFAEILRRKFVRASDMKSAELMGKMDIQLNKLTVLISDLLDVTKIEGGKLQFHQAFFDFNKLVEEVVDEMQRTTETHKIVKKLVPVKRTYGDRDRIGQVIVNFISNAIKYSPGSKKILVATNIRNNHLILSVKDYGMGIPEKEQDKVFERFFRVTGEKRNTYPGLGLGLYISSQIIQRHSGRIWVRSKVGKGSIFSFALPLEKKRGQRDGHIF
jgi:PAS domain S-box-containing protein